MPADHRWPTPRCRPNRRSGCCCPATSWSARWTIDRTRVETIDPAIMVSVTGNPDLQAVATEARTRLTAALHSLQPVAADVLTDPTRHARDTRRNRHGRTLPGNDGNRGQPAAPRAGPDRRRAADDRGRPGLPGHRHPTRRRQPGRWTAPGSPSSPPASNNASSNPTVRTPWTPRRWRSCSCPWPDHERLARGRSAVRTEHPSDALRGPRRPSVPAGSTDGARAGPRDWWAEQRRRGGCGVGWAGTEVDHEACP